MGRGGASVASPCPDSSSVFFNPAGIAFDPALSITLGGVGIAPVGQFINSKTSQKSDLTKAVYPVPNIYVSKGIGSRLAVGLGVNAPYGLTAEWDADTSEGRFLGYKSVVQGVFFQPTVAMKLNEKVSVGFGLDITYLNVQLRQRVDLSAQALAPGVTFRAIGVPPGTDFADIDLSGHAFGTGFHVGLLAKANDKVSFGVRYLSNQTIDVDNGKLTTEQIPTGRLLPISLPGLPAGTPLDLILATQFKDGAGLESGQKGTTSIPMPAQLVLGTAVKVSPKATLFADYRFVQWSKFAELAIKRENASAASITYEDYRNANAFHIGAEFEVSPKMVVRAGYFGNSGAAPDQTVTPNLPEGRRNNYSVGFGFKVSEKARLDVAYQYLQQYDRAGRSTDGGVARPTVDVNNGTYKFHANIFGASLGLRF